MHFLFMWLSFITVYFSFIPLCLSLLFIDITPFTFKGEGKQGVRILFFDTSKQILNTIHYVPLPSKRAAQRIAFEDERFKVSFDGHVVLGKAFNSQTTVLQTFGTIGTHQKRTPFKVPTDGFEQLAQTVRPRVHKAANLEIFVHKEGRREKRSLASLSFDAQSNRQERGFLGERVTDLLFLLCDFSKENGQNKSGQGLDGIFFAAKNAYLVLSESKCRQEAKTALKYMQDDLSEYKIVNRLHEIKETALNKKISTYIDRNPQHVFKLVQRLTPSGAIESALVPLDSLLYYQARYPVLCKAPITVKKRFLKETLQRLNIDENDILCFLNVKHTKKKAQAL